MTTLLWDVREAMEKKEAQDLENIIAKNSHKKSYYILKTSQWTNADCEVMKTTYMLRSTLPPRMFNTVLWKVDNVLGTIERLWDLPADVYVPAEYLDTNNEVEAVIKSAQGMDAAISASGRIV